MKVKILSFIFLNYLIFSCHAIQAAMTVEPIVQADIGHGFKGVSNIPHEGVIGGRILSMDKFSPFSIWIKVNACDPKHSTTLLMQNKKLQNKKLQNKKLDQYIDAHLYRYGGAVGGRMMLSPKWLTGGYVGFDYYLLQQAQSKEDKATHFAPLQGGYGQVVFGMEAITFPLEVNVDVHIAYPKGNKQVNHQRNVEKIIIPKVSERSAIQKVVTYEQHSFSLKVTYHYSERIKGFGGIYWLKIPEENKYWDQIVGFGGGAQYTLNNWCNLRAKLTWDNYHSISALVGVRIAVGENHLSSKYLATYLRQSPDYHYFMPIMSASPNKRGLRQYELLAQELEMTDYSMPQTAEEVQETKDRLLALLKQQKMKKNLKEEKEDIIKSVGNALIRRYATQEEEARRQQQQSELNKRNKEGQTKHSKGTGSKTNNSQALIPVPRRSTAVVRFNNNPTQRGEKGAQTVFTSAFGYGGIRKPLKNKGTTSTVTPAKPRTPVNNRRQNRQEPIASKQQRAEAPAVSRDDSRATKQKLLKVSSSAEIASDPEGSDFESTSSEQETTKPVEEKIRSRRGGDDATRTPKEVSRRRHRSSGRHINHSEDGRRKHRGSARSVVSVDSMATSDSKQSKRSSLKAWMQSWGTPGR